MLKKLGIFDMATWQADKPYNDLPALPPSQEIETKAILKQTVKARAALAELKQAAELIPNQSMLINGSRSPAMDSVYPHGQLQTRFPQLPAFQQSKSLSFVKLDQGGGIADR